MFEIKNLINRQVKMQIKKEEVSESMKREALKKELESENMKREQLSRISEQDLMKFVKEKGQTKSKSKDEYFNSLIKVASLPQK